MEQCHVRFVIPSIKTITNFHLGTYCFDLKNLVGNNVIVRYDFKKKNEKENVTFRP